jgi:PKD repeat protein
VTVPVPNVAPTASFTTSCVDSTCSFDSSASIDPDGTVNGFAWDFGDGGTSSDANPSYTYPIDGTYTVTLTVTDDDLDTGVASTSVNVPVPNDPPTASFTSDCTQLSCTFDSAESTDSDGTIDQYAWDFGDGNISTEANPTHVFAAGGSYTVTLTVTDNDLAATSTSASVTVTAAPVDVIAFVGAASSNANATTHTVQIPNSVQAGDGLLLFLAENTTATMSTPAGWTIVGTVSDDGATTRVWRKVATVGDAGSNVSVNLSAISKAGFTVAAYRGTSTVNPVAAFSGVGIGGSTTSRTTPIVAVANPQAWVVSYWSHKDSASNALTPPAGVTVRASGTQTSGGRVTTLLADSGSLVPVGNAGGLTATAPNAGTAATAWTIVLAPA